MKKDYLIFIDTNCLNENQDDLALNELESLNTSGLISIERADVMDTEMMEGKFTKGLKKSAQFIESYGPAVFDHSRWDHSVFATDQDALNFTQSLYCLFGKRERSQYRKQQMRDAMHLTTAAKYGANYFLTKDKKILSKSNQLKKILGITVCLPQDCLTEIKETI